MGIHISTNLPVNQPQEELFFFFPFTSTQTSYTNRLKDNPISMSANPSDLFNAGPCSRHTRQTDRLILCTVAIASRYNFCHYKMMLPAAATWQPPWGRRFRLHVARSPKVRFVAFTLWSMQISNLDGVEPAGAQTAQRSLEQYEGRWFDLGLVHVCVCPWAKCEIKLLSKLHLQHINVCYYE